ncbi:hypothetical protein GQ54DRAFT_296502 [Martensiomyces pterosporus]|nr:hypothetical protein GQ54DRAFT_296502 [Martensiomyces pterosporus]
MAGSTSVSQLFSERLESLGSALKSQIMSDLNSWEDRRRSEAQASRSKKFSNKRQRPLPLPEISHDTLVDIRWVRHTLYSEQAQGAATGVFTEVSQWAVGVLSVFVSVADMKGNCKLDDLISLPGARAVFQLLVLAVESGFPQLGEDDAELALITTVLAATKDPRAIGWILKQYGALHRPSFPKCLHLYAISRIPSSTAASAATSATATGSAASSPETSGLAQAIADLAAAYPAENAHALNSILRMYRDATQLVDSAATEADSIPMDDPRRYILFYMLQSHQGQKPLLLDRTSANASADLAANQEWLASAIRFEMQTGFSQFIAYTDETQAALRPLSQSIDVLYGDIGRARKASDQHLDIGRALGVISFINSIVRGGKCGKETAVDEEGDASMHSEEERVVVADREYIHFIDACHQTLVQLIAREQELVILHQMPKTVKNMPQPIPNGLQESVQRSARTYNRGALTVPVVTQDDADAVLKKLFATVSEVAESDGPEMSGQLSPALRRLHRMVCDTLPMLIEILATQMETPSVVKSLVRELVDKWPLRVGGTRGSVDMDWTWSLYRSLLAISECSRGLVLRQLLHVIEGNLKNPESGSVSLAQMRQVVDLLTAAVEHKYVMTRNPAADGSKRLHGVREVIGDLCGCLVVNWRSLWTHCFQTQDAPAAAAAAAASEGIGAVWEMRVASVRAMTKLLSLSTGLRSIDRLALTEHALRELAKLQESMLVPSVGMAEGDDIEDVRETSEQRLELCKALLSLITALARDRGVERVAMEEIVRILLTSPANPSSATATQSSEYGDSAMRELETLLEGTVLPVASGGRVQVRDEKSQLEMAESMVWQNAVRPLPKYPRDGIRNHDRAGDAWKFVRPKSAAKTSPGNSTPAGSRDKGSSDEQLQAHEIGAVNRPILVFALLSLSQCMPSGMGVLAQLLEEYYIDSIPSMPPSLLDERLSGAKLQLRPIEMELLQDCRSNRDLEFVVLEMVQDPVGGAAAKRLVSALLVALIVLWNGALGEATTKRPKDLAFTTRLVSRVLDAYGAEDKKGTTAPNRHLCEVFPLIGGSDLARILHHRVWRWAVHRIPSAEDESQKLLTHILRKHIVRTAPLFKHFVTGS